MLVQHAARHMCRYCKRAYLYRDMERDCLDYMFQTVSLSCIKDWCINYNLDMVSGRYVTEKTYDEQYGHELVIQ